MGTVLSTFLVDYNQHFSYKHTHSLDSSLSEEDFEQFTPILSRIGVEIITISSSESDSD